MAFCTVQDGLDFLANLRLSENEANLSTLALTSVVDETSDDLTVCIQKKGYLAENANPLTTLDSTQLLLLKYITAIDLAQNIMIDRAEVIDPGLLGIQKAQQNFSSFFYKELKKGKYYPIFYPAKYTTLTGSALVIPITPPTYASVATTDVTQVSYLAPGWIPDSSGQVSSDVCESWIIYLTIDIYALALKTGIYNLVSLTQRKARNLGKIINIGVAALVLQANAFAQSRQQVSVTAYEKIKQYYELRELLYTGKLE